MSVQISARIDEETKQKFDEICKGVGISPSDAISVFIKCVINHNGIPFNIAMPSNKNSKLPYARGCMKGKMRMSDDFDAPLEDFKEYME